jgi:hypothetical protein
MRRTYKAQELVFSGFDSKHPSINLAEPPATAAVLLLLPPYITTHTLLQLLSSFTNQHAGHVPDQANSCEDMVGKIIDVFSISLASTAHLQIR